MPIRLARATCELGGEVTCYEFDLLKWLVKTYGGQTVKSIAGEAGYRAAPCPAWSFSKLAAEGASAKARQRKSCGWSERTRFELKMPPADYDGRPTTWGGSPPNSARVRAILLAVATDTNPKRKRGPEVVASLTLRVGADCDNLNREQYNSFARLAVRPAKNAAFAERKGNYAGVPG